MNIEWVLIEMLAVIVEAAAVLFFLNSRFQSKYDSHLPLLGCGSAYILCGLFNTFLDWPYLVYDIAVTGAVLIFMLVFKRGSILSRIFIVFFSYAVMVATSLLGAGIAVMLTETTYQQSLTVQDTSRLVSIVLIKMIQVAIFYALAKRPVAFRKLAKRPIWVMISIAVLSIICAVLIWYVIINAELSRDVNYTLVLASMGLLVMMVLLFVMYELFAKSEMQNITLQTELQRAELQSQLYKEIDTIYADMRKWQHDYINNLVAVRALVEEADKDKALAYIDNIASEPEKSQKLLKTGNVVLDAVVSLKLGHAQSHGVDVSIQAIYPENHNIEDSDLCSVAGNLLDNAIEACLNMGESGGKRFIEFSLLLVGKNLTMTVSNSYAGEIKLDRGKYRSMKKGPYHGLGIQIVDTVVAKYDGHVLREHQDGVFSACVMFPLTEKGAK